MTGIKKRNFQTRSYIYFFMILKTLPERYSQLNILRRVNFIQPQVFISLQYLHSVLEHRQCQPLGWQNRINFSAKAFTDEFGDAAQMVHMRMSNKKDVHFFRVISKWVPVNIVCQFFPLSQPTVNQYFFTVGLKKEIRARD